MCNKNYSDYKLNYNLIDYFVFYGVFMLIKKNFFNVGLIKGGGSIYESFFLIIFVYCNILKFGEFIDIFIINICMI